MTEPEQALGSDPELLEPEGAGGAEPVESSPDDQVIEDRLTDPAGETDPSGLDPRP